MRAINRQRQNACHSCSQFFSQVYKKITSCWRGNGERKVTILSREDEQKKIACLIGLLEEALSKKSLLDMDPDNRRQLDEHAEEVGSKVTSLSDIMVGDLRRTGIPNLIRIRDSYLSIFLQHLHHLLL